MKESELKLLETLVSLFERETMFSSRPEYDHPYYKTVVAWGKQRPNDIIPWLLNHIKTNWHWCGALWMIVGKEKAPHVPEEHAGRGVFISQAWTTWGQANGYIL